jgi:hypothetical protein
VTIHHDRNSNVVLPRVLRRRLVASGLIVMALALNAHSAATQPRIPFDLSSSSIDIPKVDRHLLGPLLIEAAKSDDVDFARKLISAGANVEFDKEYLISQGASFGDQRENEFSQQTPLHFAASHNSASVARLLLEKGANPNSRDWYGSTPLHDLGSAPGAKGCSYEIATSLIAHGTNIRAMDREGWTALHSAADRSCPDVARLLIEKGADVNASTRNYQPIKANGALTPLWLAAARCDIATAKLLMNAHADIDHQEASGETVLFKATERDCTDIVSALLSRGARTAIPDQFGKRPIDVAVPDSEASRLITLHSSRR